MLTLELENWMCFSSTAIDLSKPVAFVVGSNGEGKSAILDAIRFNLSGWARGFDTLKDLGEHGVREGQKAAVVTLTLGDLRVRRAIKRTGQQQLTIEERAGERWADVTPKKLDAAQRAIEERLGLDARRMRAALSAETFVQLSKAEREAMLLEIQGQKASTEILRSAFADFNLEGGDVETVIAKIQTLGFRTTEEWAAEQRRIAKRRLGELGERPMPHRWFMRTGDAKNVDLAAAGLDVFRATLARKLQALEQAIAASAETRGALLARDREAREKLTSAEDQLANARKALDAMEEPEDPEPIERELEDWRARAGSVGRELEALEGSAAPTDTSRLDKLGAMVDRDKRAVALRPGGVELLDSDDGDVSCTNVREGIDKLPHPDDPADREAELARLRDKHKDHQKHVQMHVKSLETIHAAQDALATARSKVEAWQAAVEEAKAEVAEAAEQLAHRQGDESTISPEAARAAYEEGQKIVAAKEAYDRDFIAEKDWERDRQKWSDEVERWDAIAQALKPGGIEATMLRGLLAPIREALEEFGEFARVGMTDDLSIHLAWNGEWRSLPQLSRSQRMRVGVCFQHALCTMAGFPLLVIDEVDMLDPQSKGPLVAALRAHADRYAQVLGLATIQQRPKPMPFEDIETLVLKGGEVREVG